MSLLLFYSWCLVPLVSVGKWVRLLIYSFLSIAYIFLLQPKLDFPSEATGFTTVLSYDSFMLFHTSQIIGPGS
jgi:hypothetical protein